MVIDGIRERLGIRPPLCTENEPPRIKWELPEKRQITKIHIFRCPHEFYICNVINKKQFKFTKKRSFVEGGATLDDRSSPRQIAHR